jgi:hypothetical protein
VTQNPAIGKKGLIALAGMQIGAADADSLYAYYGLPDFLCRFSIGVYLVLSSVSKA